VADVRHRLEARIGNDVRQGGGKMLRQGGRMALSEWGEEMQHEWRQAAEKMLEPLRGVVDMDGMDTGAWVATAYQAAVKELIHE
jgi:hypothetical protein